MAEQLESIDNSLSNSNSNESNRTEDKTYHFRKGNDLDGFESFGSLFADGLFTDLAICCSGKVFRCHRVVMAASSQYMKNALSAFHNNGSNGNSNTVMIMPQDIKVNDMEAILHFIYNGQVEVTRDAIESFLASAKTLNIKGLANIKLVYNQNNQNHNQNNSNNNDNNYGNNNNNNDNNNNNNNDNNIKRRNGLIGGNRSQLKTDLNFINFNAIPQTQSFHSSPQNDSLNNSPNRRKQKFPSNAPINGFNNDSNTEETNEDSQWITITDEEEEEDEEMGNDDKDVDKIDEKERSCGEEMSSGDSAPQMPCLIQIDADPTTFPSYCPETPENGVKRRRSSSLRSLPDGKTQKNGNNSVKTNRNNDQIRKPMKMVRSSNRKLGFISFHKSSTSIWNSNKWKCEICNKLYGNKQTLKEHMDYFHSNRAEQIFTCSICNKEYTWKKSLMKHYRDIHQISNSSMPEIKQNDSLVTTVNNSPNKP
jgi:hypothetical protein